RPYALDYHVYFNGRPGGGNTENPNPTLWQLDAGSSSCPMPWNYSNNTRYQQFVGSPFVARIPRHGPYGPGTPYAVMSVQFQFNNQPNGFVGLAADDFRGSLSNRAGFLNESGTLYAYSSGPAGAFEKTPLGASWSSYAVGAWADFTFDWQADAILFYVDGTLVATHTNASTFPSPATLEPTIEGRTWPAPLLAGLRFCATHAESQVIFADVFDKTYSKYWTVVQDDFESNLYNAAGAWTGYVHKKPDGIPEVYPEIEPVEDSIWSNALMFKTRSLGGSFQDGHRDLLGLARRGNVTPFGASPVAFVRFYFKVDRHWTFHDTRYTDDPNTTWQDGNKYMKPGGYLAQQAYVLSVVLGNPHSREIDFGIGDPQNGSTVRGMRLYTTTQAIAADGTGCALYPDTDSSASWIPGALDLFRAHYPNRKAIGAPLLAGTWQEGHDEHRVNMADYNLFWYGSIYGTGDVATAVLANSTQMNGGVMRGGYLPLLRDLWYYMELEVRSTMGSSNGVGLFIGRADDPAADDRYYAPDLHFTASKCTLPDAAFFSFGENRVNGGRDKWAGIEIGPLWNQFQYMKGVYLSDLVISKTKVGNTWAASISKPVWNTAASISISNNPARLDYRSRTVTLNLDCPGATGMIIHHTRMPAGISRWTNYATTATWTLPYACGPVAVYATFRNGSGVETTAVCARTCLDIPPTLYSNVHTNRMALNTPSGALTAGPYQVRWLPENIVDDEPLAGIALDAFYAGAWHQFASGLTNDGAASWMVPVLPAAETDARLRIIIGDSFGHSVTGTTPAFTILPEPGVSVGVLLLLSAWRRAGRGTAGRHGVDHRDTEARRTAHGGFGAP
ncbi:LamG domain-containing protein, partial [bacterium]|nr:LamG domain-containing protein [bacterium]